LIVSTLILQIQAFYQEIARTFDGRHPSCRRNILSFGDSTHERIAIQKVTKMMGPQTFTKSVKFVDRPTIEQLKRQVDLVASVFDALCRQPQSLDLMLTIQLLYHH
jgi:hypothetical protein